MDMERSKKILQVSVLMLLFLNNLALAGDTVSIQISCVIPAIPGVNTPLIKEEDLSSKRQSQQDESNTNKDGQEVKYAQHREGEMIFAEVKVENKLVQTVYSR